MSMTVSRQVTQDHPLAPGHWFQEQHSQASLSLSFDDSLREGVGSGYVEVLSLPWTVLNCLPRLPISSGQTLTSMDI